MWYYFNKASELCPIVHIQQSNYCYHFLVCFFLSYLQGLKKRISQMTNTKNDDRCDKLLYNQKAMEVYKERTNMPLLAHSRKCTIFQCTAQKLVFLTTFLKADVSAVNRLRHKSHQKYPLKPSIGFFRIFRIFQFKFFSREHRLCSHLLQ